MSEAVTAATSSSAESVVQEKAQTSLLDQIVEEAKFREPAAKQRGKDLIKDFLSNVLQGEVTISKNTEAMLKALTAKVDHLLSLQLGVIMHHPEFQKLEASWRGLRYLLDNTETSPNLKIRVLNISKKELLRDQERAAEFDQSQVFKKIYQAEYDVFGGEPFAALIGDYQFGKHPDDLELLDKISHVAAAAHAPFLSSASPDLLDLNSFEELTTPRDIAQVMNKVDYVKWKSLRESEDSRYLGLCLPRTLMRLPYGRDTKPIDEFDFEEGVDGTTHQNYLWGNPAYALGARLTDAFAKYGWCAAIRGVEGGGLVEGLPTHVFRTGEGDKELKCPTETVIPDRREKELGDAGLIPLVHCKGRDYAAFFSVQSVQKPKVYNEPEATASARLSAQLPYIFAVSRFAHYLKSMVRDKIGSFKSRGECEVWLNRWIQEYVLNSDYASQEEKAKHPLRDARIEVMDVPGKPGVYRAIAFLRPHFQLDEFAVSLRLVAELPTPKK
jgi:type VI secretion system protein ImpC